MKVITFYVAEDGKKFQEEEECIKYENQLLAEAVKEEALIFGENGNRLELTRENFGGKAYVLYAKTQKAAEYFIRAFEGYENPWDSNIENACPGCWYYVGGNWVAVKDIFETADMIRKIMNAY